MFLSTLNFAAIHTKQLLKTLATQLGDERFVIPPSLKIKYINVCAKNTITLRRLKTLTL